MCLLRFRSYPNTAWYARGFLCKKNEELDSLATVVLLFVISYIVGMVIHLISKRVFGFLRFNKWLAENAYKECQSAKMQRISDASAGERATSHEHFVEFYYRFWGKDGLEYVNVLEAQFSFLRSLVIVEFLYLCIGWTFISSLGIASIALFFLLTLYLMTRVRYAIHIAYYEADDYFGK